MTRLLERNRAFETIGDMDVAAERPWMALQRVSNALFRSDGRATELKMPALELTP